MRAGNGSEPPPSRTLPPASDPRGGFDAGIDDAPWTRRRPTRAGKGRSYQRLPTNESPSMRSTSERRESA